MKHKNETLSQNGSSGSYPPMTLINVGAGTTHKSLLSEESHKRIFSGFYTRFRIHVTNYQWHHLWMPPEAISCPKIP